MDAHYPKMPPDAHHRYLNLPIDYADESSESYRAFYLLSPGFRPKGPVIFFLTDGQMELVSPGIDFSFFDEQLPGMSYVLIGHRGHSPTLFPEVYPGGKLELRQAMNLYGSWQRVEDIERVRQDMVSANLLPPDGRIMIFAASGAGMLAQQYLHRYGEHVIRTLLVTTGAPDLACLYGWTGTRNFAEVDPGTAADLSKIASVENGSRPSLAYMLFQLGRQGESGLATIRKIVRGMLTHNPLLYAWYELRLNLRWTLDRTLLSQPSADAAKVRMYELFGNDLQSAGPSFGYNLPLYVWSAEVLKDFLGQRAPLPNLQLDRSRYQGEMLVIAAGDDVIFSPAMGKAIASAYPKARFLLVRGGHRLDLDHGYQRSVRRAYFLHGLRAHDTMLLLDFPPPASRRSPE
ncbi:hypothetical protein QA648_33950 (plasmid) [Rhizobium sp. CB3171]|uniref:hypothetical protein n=1 Tax=Rhizobium sp. CB3171 TaxID=3039157 RepID=UPI0024B22EDF|nr:hypothetical protein [Rhizobium sp. CB3171]WFU06788.1 hypothetical protein QA648_33950 [Rhizobium sp. CB3171]